jgi:dTDP-4-dehydrorhamnose 3,5-epimerase/reductase
LSLAARGVDPSVVNDQFGRLTFTSELARAIRHLTQTRAPYGTYNVSGAGSVSSWADVAQRTFSLAGHDPNRVTGVSTAVYFGTAAGPVAPRPASSVLDLAKIESTGYKPVDADEMLVNYVRLETRQTYESATG